MCSFGERHLTVHGRGGSLGAVEVGGSGVGVARGPGKLRALLCEGGKRRTAEGNFSASPGDSASRRESEPPA